MCGIAGFCNPFTEFAKEERKWRGILEKMNQVQKRRGPDDEELI